MNTTKTHNKTKVKNVRKQQNLILDFCCETFDENLFLVFRI